MMLVMTMMMLHRNMVARLNMATVIRQVNMEAHNNSNMEAVLNTANIRMLRTHMLGNRTVNSAERPNRDMIHSIHNTATPD